MSKKKREIPNFHKEIIETHCHLDYLKEKSLEEIFDLSKSVGINKIITISVKPDNFQTVLDLASQYEQVFCTQGVHPHHAKDWEQKTETVLLKNISHKKVIAIGEIGLDFHYNNSPKEKQLEVFSKQLHLAASNQLPVVIHSRDADEETIELLTQYSGALEKKGVIHSFTSGPQLAQTAIDHGFYLGFNGIITFKNASEVREIVELCPLSRILLETDSPFLTPIPYRGQENHPYNLPFIAEKIAEIKKVEVEEVLETCLANSLRCFFS